MANHELRTKDWKRKGEGSTVCYFHKLWGKKEQYYIFNRADRVNEEKRQRLT